MLRTFSHIYRTEGLRGFYAGIVPTLIRDVPYAGLNYMFYNQFKQHFQRDHSSSAVFIFAGGMSGLLSTLCIYPFDVVRTRIQLKSDYRGTLDALSRILTDEGLRGLYRGIVLRLMKKVVTGAITWTSFEELGQWIQVQLTLVATGKQ